MSGQLRAAHAFEFGNWALKPRIDLGFDHASGDDFDESGDDQVRTLRVEQRSDTWYSLQPAVDLAGEFEAGNGVLIRPVLSVGLTYFLNDQDPTTAATLAGSPDGVAAFESTSELDRSYLDLGVGVDMQSKKGWNLSLNGFARMSGDIKSYGGGLRLAVPF